MAKEIEHKYLVANNGWKNLVKESSFIVQAYLSRRRDAIVRLRIYGDKAYITIKGVTIGIERDEWEYEIPLRDAEDMISNGLPEGDIIYKVRSIVPYEGYDWEIDEFQGDLSGLVLAEIETSDKDFPIPPFLGREVSHDSRFFNSNLNKELLSSL